ncbi:MAG: hypothetical protein NDI69_17560 [Bacteriovoracaceae bacterium]|nr:hypothetical protein [Bacteriovoracaceae bacterium]
MNKLLRGDSANLALAEVIAKTLSPEYQKGLKELISSMSNEEIRDMLKTIINDNSNIRNNYLYHQEAYQNNKGFLRNSLYDLNNLEGAQFSSVNMLNVSVLTYIKNKALDDIITTYTTKANELSKDLANQIILQIPEEIQEVLNEDNLEDFKAKLQKSQKYLELIDKYFKNSSINENEQYVLLASGALAGAIYYNVKDYSTVQQFIKESKKVVRTAIEIQKKGKEFLVLAKTLDDHISNTEKDVTLLRNSLNGLGNDINIAYRDAKLEFSKPSNIHSRRISDFLYRNVIKGEKTSNGDNASIFSKPVKFSENLTGAVTATQNISSNLANIIDTTNKMANLLGVKLSKDTLEIMDKANKIATVAKAATIAIQGYSQGGVVGAVGALAASNFSGMGSAFGGGDNNAAQFELINLKLDRILDNQKIIMERQIETMKMIKDLAIMVDEYHQQEMTVLAQLRDLHLVELEFQKSLLNKDIRQCERIINYQLASIWKDQDYRMDSTSGIHNVEMIKTKFLSNIRNLSDVRRILNAGGMNSFAQCQDAFGDVFGNELGFENPIIGIFSSDENNELYKWQRDTYLPLVQSLITFARTTDMDPIPLHIPSANFEGLRLKNEIINNAFDSGRYESNNYNLDNLLSVKSLERYLTRLLILYPLFEIDKNVWELPLEEIINTYINNTNLNHKLNIRSHYYLNNALKMIQTAIAQEAILAGEPLLMGFYQKSHKEILSENKCSETICAVKSNRLLMRNFIHFTLLQQARQQPNFSVHYKQAYEINDLGTLAKLFNTEMKTTRLSKVDNSIVLDSKYLLPTPEELNKGQIIYSENMPRLLKMQTLILDALEKVSPYERETSSDNILQIFSIGA